MQPDQRRDWTVPVIVTAVVLVLACVLCAVGGAGAYLLSRDGDPAPSPSASPSPSPVAASPAPPPSPPSPKSCLVGRWSEKSYTVYADIYGTKVQLRGAGAVFDFRADGTVTIVRKVTLKGTADGDRYEVIMNGTHTINYQVDDKEISYFSPQSTGTITWKINGRTRDTEKLIWITTPDRYTCQGDDLRLYGEDYATELTRVTPPGRPV
jgi:hypothetical protein